MRANMPSVDVNRPGTSRDTVIDMPEGNLSASGPKVRGKSGLNCCGKPKTKGDSEYGYELEPVGNTRKVEISGKSGGNVGVQGPKSHTINMEGGRSNVGFDGPDGRIGGVSGPDGQLPYIVGVSINVHYTVGINDDVPCLAGERVHHVLLCIFVHIDIGAI